MTAGEAILIRCGRACNAGREMELELPMWLLSRLRWWTSERHLAALDCYGMPYHACNWTQSHCIFFLPKRNHICNGNGNGNGNSNSTSHVLSFDPATTAAATRRRQAPLLLQAASIRQQGEVNEQHDVPRAFFSWPEDCHHLRQRRRLREKRWPCACCPWSQAAMRCAVMRCTSMVRPWGVIGIVAEQFRRSADQILDDAARGWRRCVAGMRRATRLLCCREGPNRRWEVAGVAGGRLLLVQIKC